MSTKIYDGCKINVSSLFEFQKFIRDLRSRVLPEIKRVILRKALYHVADLIDGNAPLNSKEGLYGNILRYGYDQYRKELKDLKQHDQVPHRASVSVFFLEDKVLAIPFIADPVVSSKFTGHPDVEEYGYWDNTDQPDEVTDEEWSQRDVDWGNALGGDYLLTPVEAGVSIVLDEPEYKLLGIPLKDEDIIMEELVKVNERYKENVKKVFTRDYLIKRGIERPQMNHICEAYQEFREVFKETPEYLDLCETCKKDMVEITPDLLKEKISTFKGASE